MAVVLGRTSTCCRVRETVTLHEMPWTRVQTPRGYFFPWISILSEWSRKPWTNAESKVSTALE